MLVLLSEEELAQKDKELAVKDEELKQLHTRIPSERLPPS